LPSNKNNMSNNERTSTATTKTTTTTTTTTTKTTTIATAFLATLSFLPLQPCNTHSTWILTKENLQIEFYRAEDNFLFSFARWYTSAATKKVEIRAKSWEPKKNHKLLMLVTGTKIIYLIFGTELKIFYVWYCEPKGKYEICQNLGTKLKISVAKWNKFRKFSSSFHLQT